jgi:predicted kinase
MLIILSGLPGTGKTTIARELARRLPAVHVRIDSIEQAIRGAGVLRGPLDDAGYRVGYAVAEDNLRVGLNVVADSVNPLSLTRSAWRDAAARAGVRAIDVEVVCSDPAMHRRRVEERVADLPGHRLPTWAEVVAREYHAWTDGRLVIDTASTSVESAVGMVLASLRLSPGSPSARIGGV